MLSLQVCKSAVCILSHTGFYLTCDTYSDDEWYRNFRISWNTFHFLVDELRMNIIRQDTVMRKAAEVRKKIAFFLYFIGSTDGYRSLPNLFGVSRAFVSSCIREVEDAFLKIQLLINGVFVSWRPRSL